MSAPSFSSFPTLPAPPSKPRQSEIRRKVKRRSKSPKLHRSNGGEPRKDDIPQAVERNTSAVFTDIVFDRSRFSAAHTLEAPVYRRRLREWSHCPADFSPGPRPTSALQSRPEQGSERCSSGLSGCPLGMSSQDGADLDIYSGTTPRRSPSKQDPPPHHGAISFRPARLVCALCT